MARSESENIVRRVDLLTLRIFLAVVEEGQLSRAAAREHIVPSSVTKRIQELEDVIGIKLLLREPRGISLTSAGEIVARHVRAIMDNVEEMRAEVAAMSVSVHGRLRICASESVIIEFIAEEIGKFAANFPNVEIALLQRASPDILRTITAQEADIGIFPLFGNASPGTGTVDIFDYRTDPLAVLIPRNHKLAGLARITLADLAGADLIGLRPHAPLMEYVRGIAQQQGIALQVKFELTSNEAARAMVRAGLGVSLQPSAAIGPDDYGTLTAIEVDAPWATRRICIAARPGRALSSAGLAFLKQLRLRSGDGGGPVSDEAG